MPRRNLREARVLVTGASSGIGRALAVELARRGAKLLLLARSADRLEALAKQLAAMNATPEIVVGDVTDPAVRQAALAKATEKLGGLDILVNNAGAGALGAFAGSSPERLRTLMEVNFFAPAEFIREAVPTLRQGTHPLVVNVGSVLGLRAIPRMVEYCSAKYAIQGLSESLRPELFHLGIDLLMVCPGRTETEFGDHMVERRGDRPWSDVAGLPPEKCAERISRAMESGRRMTITDWPAWWLWIVNRVMPGMVDRYLLRYG